MLKYHQELSNSCFLGSLSSAVHNIGDNRAGTDPENIIEELLIFHKKIDLGIELVLLMIL